MKIKRKKGLTFLLVTAVLLSGCANNARGLGASPTSKATAEAETEEATATEILTGPIATANALNAQVTLNAPTPVGGIEVQGPDDYVGLFMQAWNVIEQNYVRDSFNGVDWDQVYAEYLPQFESIDNREDHFELMSALVLELHDNHSRFVPPENMQSEFGVGSSGSGGPRPWTGLVIWPAKEDEQLLIWKVCEVGPGTTAGLHRGDVILAIDGDPVVKSDEDWETDDYIGAIFGTGGETVTLSVLQGPNAQAKSITLTLGGATSCDGWDHYLVSESPRIGYIRVPAYEGNAAAEILSAIDDLESDAPLDGLILDERHNPGGNSDESSSIFAEGIVGTVGPLREDTQRTIYRIRGPVDWNTTTPLVVLIDGNSHSAADYFPAAMKELERATIIGMPSAGNTEGITSFILADGTLIRLAVTTLALNDETILEGVGVTPNVFVPLSDWGLRQTPYDAQLQAAIDFLSK